MLSKITKVDITSSPQGDGNTNGNEELEKTDGNGVDITSSPQGDGNGTVNYYTN